MKNTRYQKPSVIVAAILSLVMLLPGCIAPIDSAVDPKAAETQALAAQAAGITGPTDYTQTVINCKPYVVAIDVQFRDRFGRVQEGSGSGWIFRADGIIVTNRHVIQDQNTGLTAEKVTVTIADGRVVDATKWLAASASALDLAVIKIPLTGLPVAVIGDSTKLQVGEPVAAVGNALGLGISMKGGWVSRLNVTAEGMTGLIETDAAINPGNSGGPLVDYSGRIVGINTLKLVDVDIERVGYAISINGALSTINLLITQL
jgi:S1-C subfamily serine protease